MVAAAFTVVITALLIAFPDVLLNPGPLMKGHHAFGNRCLSCHQPFAGAGRQCQECHKLSDIGIRDSAGRSLVVRNKKALFHRALAGKSCLECHVEHKGGVAKYSKKTFMHDSLSTSLKNDCMACHTDRKPADVLHRSTGNACATCHSTDNWKSAVFNHTRQVVLKNRCVDCHKGDIPADTLHRHLRDGCATCHSTSHWKPATFSHDRYFRLDRDHRATCVTCHDKPGNYKAYTCMNCHDHSPSKMAREHHEEGIRNYSNCIRCHRSAESD